MSTNIRKTISRKSMSTVGLAALVASGFLAVGAPPAQAAEGAMAVATTGKITGTPNGYCRSGNSHDGFDIAAPTGQKVVAAADGTVDLPSYSKTGGNRVVINHTGGWESRYLHLNSIAVKDGQKVVKGQTIGTVGSTGRSTGPHLHFQIEQNNNVIRSSALLDDFRCGTTVTQGRSISYSFPGLPTNDAHPVTNYPKLRMGDRGESVKNLQNLLNARGFSVGNVDGSFGPKTDQAVKNFQRTAGTTSDGVVGPKTWGALEARGASDAKLRLGSQGEDVKSLQRALNATLGKNFTVDGKFGAATKSAVVEYQKSRGLTSDGVVGQATWGALKGGR